MPDPFTGGAHSGGEAKPGEGRGVLGESDGRRNRKEENRNPDQEPDADTVRSV